MPERNTAPQLTPAAEAVDKGLSPVANEAIESAMTAIHFHYVEDRPSKRTDIARELKALMSLAGGSRALTGAPPKTMAEYLSDAEQALGDSYCIDFDDSTPIQPDAMHWGNRLPIGGLTVISSPPGTGKGFLSMQLCRAFAEGTSVDGYSDAVPQGLAMYLSAEDSENVLRTRVAGSGIRLDARKYVKAYDTTKVSAWFGNNIGPLLKEIETIKPAILILDNLEAIASRQGRHTNDNDIRIVNDFFSHLAAAHSMVVVMLHHDNKSMGSGNSSNAYSGSTQIKASARSMLHLFEDRHLKVKAIECVKNNLADDSEAAIGKMTFSIVTNQAGMPGVKWLGINNAADSANDIRNQEQLEAKAEQRYSNLYAVCETAQRLAESDKNTATGIIEALKNHSISQRQYYRIVNKEHSELFSFSGGAGSHVYVTPVPDWQEHLDKLNGYEHQPEPEPVRQPQAVKVMYQSIDEI